MSVHIICIYFSWFPKSSFVALLLEFPINADERGNNFEADIVLHETQLINPYNGILNTYWRWENGIIPYEMPANHHSEWRISIMSERPEYTKSSLFADAAEQATIRRAMDEISKWTCIKFVVRTTQPDYIRILNDNTGCWSYVGRIRGPQALNLHNGGGCVSFGISMHELMHAIGFFHSHSDLNRDAYIRVQYENIEDYAVSNFAAYSNNYVTNYGHGYDYGSILHYGAMSFTKNGLPTLVPIQPYSGVIGQRNNLSEKDILKVNAMYSCPGKPEPTTLPPTTLPPTTTTKGKFQFGKLP